MLTVLYHMFVTLPLCFIGWFIVYYAYSTGTDTDKVAIWMCLVSVLVGTGWLGAIGLRDAKKLAKEREVHPTSEEGLKLTSTWQSFTPEYSEFFKRLHGYYPHEPLPDWARSKSCRGRTARPALPAQPAIPAKPARPHESTKNCPPNKWE